MVEFTYQMVLSTLQTIALIVGIIYYLTMMQNQSRSRQIQIIGSISDVDLDYDFLNWDTGDYDGFMAEHGPKADPEGWKAMNSWFNRLELQGVYVREGLLDVRLVCLMSGGTIIESWEMYQGLWEEWRRRYDRPRDWVEAEYLYERVVEYMAGYPELGI